MTDASDTLTVVASLFDRVGLAYALIGGHAVNQWLEPRLTADIDVTVAADPEALARLTLELDSMGYHVNSALGVDEASGADFIRYVRGPADPPIELLTAKTPLQVNLLARARREGGIAVATAEDLIVLKLIAHRTKDLGDLYGLLALPGLDWNYIENEAATWEVSDRLRRLREALTGTP